MKVNVRLFASLREIFKSPYLEVELPEGATVADLVEVVREEAPHLGHGGRFHVTINKEFVEQDAVLHDGDEVAIFPPVGGGQEVKKFRITAEPLSLDAVAGLVTAPEVGGIALFSGTVRGVTEDIDTEYLEYEAYTEMAEAKLAEIGAEVQQRWPQVLDIAMIHRVGRVNVGDPAVVIAVAAAHRDGIFDACAYAIDRIKHIAPIWKKEVTPSGDFWVEGPVDETSPPVIEV
jgi:molybdopterin synthase catalytic subunit